MTKQEQLRLEADLQKVMREVKDVKQVVRQHRIDFIMSLVGFCAVLFLTFFYVTSSTQMRDEYALNVLECMTKHREDNPDSWLTDQETYETCRIRENRRLR